MFLPNNIFLELPAFSLGTLILLSDFLAAGLYNDTKPSEENVNSAPPSLQPRKRQHKEVYEAKNLIDALSFKLHLNMKSYQTKSASLQRASTAYHNQTVTTENELKHLNRLKHLLNELTSQAPAICEKFYSDFDFAVSHPIIIKTTGSALPKHYTMRLQVNHRRLIDNGLALRNGNDLRIYYLQNEKCQARELDRIIENVGTANATVLFQLQEELYVTIAEEASLYFLVYSKVDARPGKEDPENIYLFHEDFSEKLEKWQHNSWGSIKVVKGHLELRTRDTPTRESAEVAVYVKHGGDWKDIEVELDMMEENSNQYPGPFLRTRNPDFRTTSGWWFEYHSDQNQCTLRPYVNNRDGSWVYKAKLRKPLVVGTWIHAKYRVVGDRFSHWVNGDVVHDNVRVISNWMISQGTLGLGCHTNSIGCHTLYDNIVVTQYVPAQPTITLGTECMVDLNKFHGLGTSVQNPATSCKQIHDISLHDGEHRLQNGAYWIKTAADESAPTYCDLVNGGWTLVGKVSGHVGDIYKTWLVTNQDVKNLSTPMLSVAKHLSCIDARYLAAHHASTIMLASGENSNGIGAKWVQWSLPPKRESKTLWTHGVGFTKVSESQMSPVKVKSSNGGEQLCYQNQFGISPQPGHGGSYPAATYNKVGNTDGNDYCMSVGVQTKGTTADGWIQNGNGYDSPQSKFDWPNKMYHHESPFVTIWLQ